MIWYIMVSYNMMQHDTNHILALLRGNMIVTNMNAPDL